MEWRFLRSCGQRAAAACHTEWDDASGRGLGSVGRVRNHQPEPCYRLSNLLQHPANTVETNLKRAAL